MAVLWIWLALTTGSMLLCASGFQIPDGTCTYRKWEEPGDLKLLIIGGVYENEAGKCSDQVSKHGIPLLLTFDWLIQTLNGNNSNNPPFIPGLKIGYEIYENCDNADLTTDLLYTGRQMSNCSGQQTSQDNQAVTSAVISLTSPEVTRTLSRLVHPLPVVRPLPSTPLLNAIPNLLQTVAPFKFEVKALVDLMVEMKWNYIALVHEDTDDGHQMTIEFKQQADDKSICVNFQYILQTSSTTIVASAANITKDVFNHISNAYKQSIVIVYLGGLQGAKHTVESSKTQTRRPGSKLTWVFPASIGNDDVLKALVDKEDGDIMVSVAYPVETIQEISTHSQSVLDRSKVTPVAELVRKYKDTFGPVGTTIDHASNMINGVLLLASALKNVWEDSCTSGELCPSLPNDIKENIFGHAKNGLNVTETFESHYLPQAYNGNDVTVDFESDGTTATRIIDILLYTPHTGIEQKLVTYNGNAISDISVLLPTSACATVCWECREAVDLRYSYLPGDYLILGLFSVRVYDEGTQRCQAIRRGTNDIITVSAFMQSIIAKRNNTGLNFGGIAIDDCYSAYNTSYYLSGLFSKTMIIRDPATGLPVDFDRVIAIIGALSSSVSLVIGDTATSLRLPMISYAASSPELDNRHRYPYFLRTVPSDILQVQGIIQLIKYLNVTRVGVIYIDDSYGGSGLRNLEIVAAQNNICIDFPLSVNLGMSDLEINMLIRKLYEHQLGVVVYFSIDSIAQRLLELLYEYDKPIDRPIVFIASEAWGTNRALIRGNLGRESKGSLVFNIAALQYENSSFKTYLQNLNISQSEHNRWLPNFFEQENNCYLLNSFEKDFNSICTGETKTKLESATIENLYQDQRGIHVLNAVHTVTEAYTILCSNKSPASCSRQRPIDFVSEIHDTLIRNERVYTPGGNGNIGMTIYNIQRNPTNPNDFHYEQVGSLSKDGILDISRSPLFYNGVENVVTNILEVATDMDTYTDCNMFEDSCAAVCLQRSSPAPDTTTRETATEATAADDGLMKGLTIAFGALAGLMAVALVLLIVLLFRRTNLERNSSDGKYSTEATSVDPGNASIYDEPGTIHYERSRSETDFREQRNGSFLSLQENMPTQYAKIQPSPRPIHHKRHRSNQELVSQMHHFQDRPPSHQSAPLTHFQNSPAVRHIIAANKRSPRPSYSPHGTLTRPSHSPHGTMPSNSPRSASRDHHELYRKRGNSSPTIRYPSSKPSYGFGLKESSVDGSPVLRRQALVSDDYDRNSVFVDEGATAPSIHYPEGYLYPHAGSKMDDVDVDKPKLTYLTANDLVREESVDEEDKPTNNASNAQNTDFVDPVNTRHTNNQMQQYGYDPSLISPSDSEIVAINFPESDKVGFSKSQTSQKQFPKNQREGTLLDSPDDRNKGPIEPRSPRAGSSSMLPVPTRSNQPDIIQEIGPFESDTSVIII